MWAEDGTRREGTPCFGCRGGGRGARGCRGIRSDTSNALCRTSIVSRSEIDLANIKDAYFSKYQRTLLAAVRSETSSDYKRLLSALIGEDALNPEVSYSHFLARPSLTPVTNARMFSCASHSLPPPHPRFSFIGSVRVRIAAAQADAKILRKALKGLGTDEDKVGVGSTRSA